MRNRRARVQPGLDQPRSLASDRRPRHLLRARPVEPENLDDRRQRRHQRRRPALPLVRHDDQPRAGRRIRRRRGCDPSHIARRLRLRSHRALGRLRGYARPRHRGRRPAAGAARSRFASALAAFPDVEAASEAVSAIIARRDRADRARDHGPTDHRRRRGALPRRLPARRRRRAAGRDRRTARRHRRRRSRDRAHRASSTARSRGARRPIAAEREALWASRKGAAGALGRIAPNYYIQDACVPRTKLPAVDPRDRADRARHTICRSATSFTPATATCTRCCASTAATRARCEPSSKPGPRFSRPASRWAARSAASTASATRSAIRSRSSSARDDLAAMGRVRDVFDPRRAVQSRQDLPDRRGVRRSSRAGRRSA